ncbi:MAG TPA: hypothetical protein V6C93_35265, partial [Allocoleopsis sp.]
MTNTVLLRSRVMRKYQARFWRAAALVRESPTLIFNGANNIALVGLFINQPRGTGLSCKLNRTIEYVQLNLFGDFRATENP